MSQSSAAPPLLPKDLSASRHQHLRSQELTHLPWQPKVEHLTCKCTLSQQMSEHEMEAVPTLRTAKHNFEE
jgi:hypothetical protein